MLNRSCLSLVIGAVVCSQVALAQDGSAVLEEVVVTATKRATNLQDTPIAVSAFSQDALDRHQIKDLRGLTDLVPSLMVSNHSDSAALFVTLRGIGGNSNTELADPTVAFHVDGVYAPRVQGAATLMYDVDRVEVLRGPQGTLFGRNATVGSINIHTNKPEIGEYNGNLSVTTGTYDLTEVKGAVNLPVSDTLALRVAGINVNRGGYTKVIGNYAGRGPHYGATVADLTPETQFSTYTGEGPESDDRQSWRLSGLWQPNENLSWFLSAERYEDNSTGSPQLDPFLADRGDRVQVIDSNIFTDLTTTTYRSRIDYTFGNDLTFSHVFGYSEMQRSQVFDADGGTSNSFQENRTESSNFESYMNEFQLKNSDDARFRWLLGFFNNEEDNEINFVIDFAAFDEDGNTSGWIGGGANGGAGAAYFIQPQRELSSTAAFAQGTYDINDSNRLTVGLRYLEDEKSDSGGRSINCELFGRVPDRNNALNATRPLPSQIFADAGAAAAIAAGLPYDNGTNAGNNGEPCWVRQVNDKEADWDKVTWLLRYEMDLSGDFMAYASAGTGFKSGHIQDEFNIADPEEVESLEVGMKTDFFGGAMRLNTAFYTMDYEGYQVATTNLVDTDGDGIVDSQGSQQILNASDLDVMGFEFEFLWAITDATRLQLVGNIMDAEFGDYIRSDGQFGDRFNPSVPLLDNNGNPIPDLTSNNLNGNTPKRAPDFEFTTIVSHDIELAGGTLTPQVTLRVVDDYFLDDFNRGDIDAGEFGQAAGARNLSIQESYEMWDLSLRYESDRGWGIEAWVKNASDEVVRTDAGGFVTPDGLVGQLLPPRTAGVTFKAAFE
ncbi:TonB-dependent receptor [Exilibacterium tricleocarpae]|nr:TonB-dependent receptor [Exilibacterium tricleocarpae]